MAIASASAPSLATIAPTASRVERPQRSCAGSTRTPCSSITRYDGVAARPVINTASNPVRLSVAGKRPPKVESKKSPVSGDLVATSARLLPGIVVSVIGPTPKTTALAGSNASTPAGTRSSSSRAASPLPPSSARAIGSSSASTRELPSLTSTERIRPPYPFTARYLNLILCSFCPSAGFASAILALGGGREERASSERRPSEGGRSPPSECLSPEFGEAPAGGVGEVVGDVPLGEEFPVD